MCRVLVIRWPPSSPDRCCSLLTCHNVLAALPRYTLSAIVFLARATVVWGASYVLLRPRFYVIVVSLALKDVPW